MRKHVLAQKANRSRRYGRIGSVSQQQTTPPRILSVDARYPRLKKTEKLFNEKEGVIRGLRAEPQVRLRVSCIAHQPFYLYGTFHDTPTFRSSARRRFGLGLHIQHAFVRSRPEGPCFIDSPPPHFSHEYISEVKSDWVRSRSQFAGDEDFFNLGFTPVIGIVERRKCDVQHRRNRHQLVEWS